MNRTEMVEVLYHEMKDVLSPGSARALAERVMKLVESIGLPETMPPAEIAQAAKQVLEENLVFPEDPVTEVTATVMKAEKAKKTKKTEE